MREGDDLQDLGADTADIDNTALIAGAAAGDLLALITLRIERGKDWKENQQRRLES